jgi:HD-GYP domain-containing protein (c-di-GMP phosphodiesterase class II)
VELPILYLLRQQQSTQDIKLFRPVEQRAFVYARELSVGSRILAVADSFAILTENRPDHTAKTEEEGIATLKNMGLKNSLDRNVIRLVEENPDGEHRIFAEPGVD